MVFHLIRDRAKVLRFKRGEIPVEIPVLVQQAGGTLNDSMTGDSWKNTVPVLEMQDADTTESCEAEVENEATGMDPHQLMNYLLNKRRDSGMYQELDTFFANGYVVEQDGKQIRKEGTPVEYSIVTGTYPGAIDALMTGLDGLYHTFPMIKSVPMYRRVLKEHLKQLEVYVAQEIEDLQDDSTDGTATEENEAVTCHAVTKDEN